MTWEFRLPRDVRPVWPDRCVRCEERSPDAPIRLRWSRWRTWGHSGKPYEVSVPACFFCAPAIRHERFINTLLLWGGAAAGGGAVLLIDATTSGIPNQWHKWAFLGGVGLGAALGAVWPIFFRPPPVDIDINKKTVDFTFRSREYAKTFRLLNPESRRIGG